MSIAEAASRCLSGGLTSVKAEEVVALRSLYIKEARKGAFSPVDQDPLAVREAFCRHVVQNFSSNTLTVLDCLPYFRQKASEQLGDNVPLAALILYATWVEHWINVLITMGMLRRGSSDLEVENYFRRQPISEDKVAHLESICTSPLPDKPRGWLTQIIKTRARYHHYTWQGADNDWLTKDLKGLTALVRKGDSMIDALLAFEHAEFDIPVEPMARLAFPDVPPAAS